jgi:small subunit ribosomal protein S6
VHKAHYVLMNVECNQEALNELTSAFRFNDAVIRNLVIYRDDAVIDPSPLAKSKDERESRGSRESADKREEQEFVGEAPAAEVAAS